MVDVYTTPHQVDILQGALGMRGNDVALKLNEKLNKVFTVFKV